MKYKVNFTIDIVTDRVKSFEEMLGEDGLTFAFREYFKENIMKTFHIEGEQEISDIEIKRIKDVEGEDAKCQKN